MDTATIRQTYLDFFAERGHTVVPSSSLIPDDPSLLLTIAGVIQFRPYLVGERPPPYPRAVSSQKCFREVDIDEVGRNTRTLTFFEMLGNWSFGDYFKREACAWAWELMTGSFGFESDRILVTVFEKDDQAAQIWSSEVGIPESRILRSPNVKTLPNGRVEDGNFWDAWAPGPGGPCSELLYDRGPEFGSEYVPGEPMDDDRYLELWNLVFMQFMLDGSAAIESELPNANIDTGMGLERMSVLLQGVDTVFEIDTLGAIRRTAEELTGSTYGDSESEDERLRVLADHARAISFLVSDGILPGNTGRGYVLRRLIRRAVRFARLLGVDRPFLDDLTHAAVEIYRGAYPELSKKQDLLRRVVTKEEERFDSTLRHGLGLLEDEIERVKRAGKKSISGAAVFKLHDTYGFPLDLAAEIAADEGLEVDREEYTKLMTEQKDRARSARGKTGQQPVSLTEIKERNGATDFGGYEVLETESTVVGVLENLVPVPVLQEGASGEVVLDRTAFYAESGGQVGDRGVITTPEGRFEVEDTQWGVPGVIIHKGRVVAGSIQTGSQASASVDPLHRAGVRESHTATHILHWKLRDALGEHVTQQGSLVEPGRLRFDFSHMEAVGAEQLDEIGHEMNSRVILDDPVHAFWTTYDYAIELGAMALFGEKYGEQVRVVEVGDYSRELCGGTHVMRTGQVGIVKILHEGSAAAGIRRVEALTGTSGLAYLNAQISKLERIARMMKTDTDQIVERVEKLLSDHSQFQKLIDQQTQASMRAEVEGLIKSEVVKSVGGVNLAVVRRDSGSVDELRKLAGLLRDGLGSSVVVVGGVLNGKASIVATVSDDLSSRGISSRDLISSAGSIIGGGGGGTERMAVAGGTQADNTDAALNAAADAARTALASLGN